MTSMKSLPKIATGRVESSSGPDGGGEVSFPLQGRVPVSALEIGRANFPHPASCRIKANSDILSGGTHHYETPC